MIEFVAVFAFVVLLGAFLLWSRRTVSAALIFAALSVTVAVGLVEMQARPKPINMEWRSPAEAEVLWYRLEEGVALYFILHMPQGPRFYVMPWDGAAAEKLLQAGRESEKTGGTLRMSKPFEPSLSDDDERLFYSDPQPAPPPKG